MAIFPGALAGGELVLCPCDFREETAFGTQDPAKGGSREQAHPNYNHSTPPQFRFRVVTWRAPKLPAPGAGVSRPFGGQGRQGKAVNPSLA